MIQKKKQLYKAHLEFGFSDRELLYPLLVVQHAVLGAADKLRTQDPPGQAQFENSLGGSGPVPQRDHSWDADSIKKIEY